MSSDGLIPAIRVTQGVAIKLPVYIVDTSDFRTAKTGLALTGWFAGIYSYLTGGQNLQNQQPDLEVGAATFPGVYLMNLSAVDIGSPGIYFLQIFPPGSIGGSPTCLPYRVMIEVVPEYFKIPVNVIAASGSRIHLSGVAEQGDDFFARNLLTVRTGLAAGHYRKVIASETLWGATIGASYTHDSGSGNAAITIVGVFADYSFNSGDHIRITGGTAGGSIDAQTIEIGSRLDDDTIVLVGQPTGATSNGTIDIASGVMLTLDDNLALDPAVDDKVVLTSE